jgi:coproporphyrinogen III oxidase-like Fe-S oxidoreductase
VMLGLRLDEPLPLAGLEVAVDDAALERLERLGLAAVAGEPDDQLLALTHRGRFLGGGVTAELLA